MQLGMIGLGRMGANMVRRLLRAGHECVVFDRNAEAVEDVVKEGPIRYAIKSSHQLASVREYRSRSGLVAPRCPHTTEANANARSLISPADQPWCKPNIVTAQKASPAPTVSTSLSTGGGAPPTDL